jgi:HEAT repeat protein
MSRPLSVLALVVPVTALVIGPAPARGQTDFLGKPVSHWLQALKDPSPEVRRGAAFALGKCGSAAVPAVLARALGDGEGGVRDAAAYGLGELAAENQAAEVWSEAGSELTRLLAEDRDPRVRRSAAFALGSCGAKAAGTRAALVKALGDRDPMVRQNAAWALGRLGTDGAEEAARGLARALSDGDAVVRRDAAAALGEVGAPAGRSATPALLACLTAEPEATVRVVVLDSLVKLVSPKDTDLTAGLARLLKHQNKEVAHGAALALGKIGGPEARAAVPTLSEALQDPDAGVRELAAAALAGIGEPAEAAVTDLGAALRDPSPAVRRNAALALSHIGPKAASVVPQLGRALDPQQPHDVRFFAAEALYNVGPTAAEPVVPELLRILKEDKDQPVRQRAVYVLVNVQNKELLRGIYPALEAALGETDPRSLMVRYDAARALAARLGPDAPPKAIDVLLQMIKDPNLRVYHGSDSTLQTGDERSRRTTTVKENLAGDARFMAAVALEQIGPRANRPEVIEALQEAARSKDDTTRKAAEAALKKIKGKG